MAKKKVAESVDAVDAVLDDSNMEVEVVEPATLPPDRSSPEWNDYVLSCFFDSEMVDGRPTVDGLRRVTEMLVGTIVACRCHPYQSPTNQDKLAIAQCEIELSNGVVRSDVGEACGRNNDEKFIYHLTATATTRAEGRVLRKLLGLRVISAEESGETPNEDEIDASKSITNSQIMFIDTICSRNDINAWGYINSGSLKFKKLSDIPYTKAREIVDYLSELQNNQSKIPSTIKGYDSNWKKEVE